MQTAASNSLVLTEFSSSKGLADSHPAISHGGLYQVIASSLTRSVYKGQVFRELGDRLVALAEHSYAFRQVDALEQISRLLVNSPLPREYETVGRYYQALCIQKFGRGDVQGAARLLERVAENAPPRYRARAMISLGTNSCYRGDNQSALSAYCQAAHFVSRSGLYDTYATVHTQKMVAVIKSEDGNHRGARALLGDLLPLAQSMRWAQPHVYYDYLNSFAVELCAVGRLEEAKNISEIVLASPFALAYPEWHETLQEIELRGRRASRSTVGFSHSMSETVEENLRDGSSEAQRPLSVLAEFAVDSAEVSQATAEASNILRFPVREQGASGLAAASSNTREPARVLVMSERNKTDSKETQAKNSYEDLDGRQLLLKIMELTAATDTTDHELLEILKSIESILFRQGSR